MDSFLPRIGGKKLLRGTICEMFPESGYDRYIEVFGGMAWVLLHKDKHAALEVYNDADGGLVNLMRCVKYHLPELMRELACWLNSREMFFDALEQLECRGLTDIQRAARYYVKIRYSYGADGKSFGGSKKSVATAMEKLQAVSDRFIQNSVVVENKDFESLIKQYDRDKALFYCDPPYYKAEGEYDVVFIKDDHARLRRCLGDIKGRFLLSYNDCEFVREMYKEFRLVEVERGNNLGKGKYKELIIMNY